MASFLSGLMKPSATVTIDLLAADGTTPRATTRVPFVALASSTLAEDRLRLGGSERTAQAVAEESGPEVYVYRDDEAVRGTVRVAVTKRMETNGVAIELLGAATTSNLTDLFNAQANKVDFLTDTVQLAPPGTVLEARTHTFDFALRRARVHDSYAGTTVQMRYRLRAMVRVKSSPVNASRELEVWQENTAARQPETRAVKREVGVENVLHIEFDYGRQHYHLRDALVGKIYFLVVRLKIKRMEVLFVRKEYAMNNLKPELTDSHLLQKFEIMDGSPVRGEAIPLRFFLNGVNCLTPTYDNKRAFQVKYVIDLILVDEDDHRYRKEQEIVLWRKGDNTVLIGSPEWDAAGEQRTAASSSSSSSDSPSTSSSATADAAAASSSSSSADDAAASKA